ncbi:MAG: ABC transporter ATP-binding protein [SAR324 cluster bacterium]|jgi:peptide/nickel transport system ATP-binding protein|nr:dipeptide/oligopeptide/nickel ABC transporter ATP-binding protein [Bacteroidota bacterium]MDP7501922.1 ABC transporter ATP-binding protein [SAR324 cluster bacterium]
MTNNISLNVEDLTVHYGTPTGDILAVNGVSFNVEKGEALGLVGESGCGKSTAAYGILRLVQHPGKILGGKIVVDGIETNNLNEEEFRKLRATKLALIPQGAMNSLNPTMRVFGQIKDQIQTHEGKQNPSELKDRIEDLLKKVGLPARISRMFPHELSGGMKQRVCIAIGIALHPSLVIADESTSALDVIVQRIVAQTLSHVQKEMGVSMIMIGHDMGLMAQMVDRVAVMYAGNLVEISKTKELFKNPAHPYSKILIESIPSIKEKKPLKLVEGITHDPRKPPPGCIFQLRCPMVESKCKEVQPELKQNNNDSHVACHLAN